MKRMTTRGIRRLLAAGGTPEPPAGLADRIKAEIPEVLQVGGAGPSPVGVRGMPARVPALRPLWLLAASLLVVIGAGFVAVRFFAPATDIAREIALGGVVRIEDIVVTVPERSTVERQRAAAADAAANMGQPIRVAASAMPAPAAKSAPGKAKGEAASSRAVGSLAFRVSDGKEPLPGVAIVATGPADGGGLDRKAVSDRDGRAEIRSLPPGEYSVRTELPGYRAAGATVRVAGGAERRIELSMGQAKVAEEVEVTGNLEAAQGLAATASVARRDAASSPAAGGKGSIVVTVHDAGGRPVPGALLILTLRDRPDVNCGSRVTGSAGVATFCCVSPAAYRICAQLEGFAAAFRDDVDVPDARQLEISLTMERVPAGGPWPPWTCPTPAPPRPR